MKHNSVGAGEACDPLIFRPANLWEISCKLRGLHEPGALADDLHGLRRSVALVPSRMVDSVRFAVEGTLDYLEMNSVATKP